MYNFPIAMIPPRGYVLAYFKEKLVFEPYEIKGEAIDFESCGLLSQETPRECHFFDQDREYRLVRRDFQKDYIEKVYTREEEEGMDPDLVFMEDVMVKPEYPLLKKLRIINRYTYSPNDTLILKNYRISYE